MSNEIFHSIRKKKGNKGRMALKIDFDKAYDRINWSFVLSVFSALGFNETWVSWLEACISTVSFRILLNDIPGEKLFPCCGLRQGDPLSPYIFITYLEILSQMINDGILKGTVYGFKIAVGAPMITDSFYADDSLIFPEASIKNVRVFGTF